MAISKLMNGYSKTSLLHKEITFKTYLTKDVYKVDLASRKDLFQPTLTVIITSLSINDTISFEHFQN